MEGLVGYGVFGDDKGSEVCDFFVSCTEGDFANLRYAVLLRDGVCGFGFWILLAALIQFPL